jgi:hypothetical protein
MKSLRQDRRSRSLHTECESGSLSPPGARDLACPRSEDLPHRCHVPQSPAHIHLTAVAPEISVATFPPPKLCLQTVSPARLPLSSNSRLRSRRPVTGHPDFGVLRLRRPFLDASPSHVRILPGDTFSRHVAVPNCHRKLHVQPSERVTADCLDGIRRDLNLAGPGLARPPRYWRSDQSKICSPAEFK